MSDKADDADGLTPVKEDNAGERKKDRKDYGNLAGDVHQIMNSFSEYSGSFGRLGGIRRRGS